MESDFFENEDLNRRLTNCEEIIPVVLEYETFISIKKKGILNIAYRQGLLFKIFKESNKFVEMLQNNVGFYG